jgi:hypothetical protein
MKPMIEPKTGPKTHQSRGKIDLFSPRQLAHETGIPQRNILIAIRGGTLRCLRLNRRHFLIRSQDAAKWLSSLASDAAPRNMS